MKSSSYSLMDSTAACSLTFHKFTAVFQLIAKDFMRRLVLFKLRIQKKNNEFLLDAPKLSLMQPTLHQKFFKCEIRFAEVKCRRLKDFAKQK